MENFILFLGKWDKNLAFLENKVINLQNREEQNPIKETDPPDVKKHQINGFNSNAWAIHGEVNPTLLLKNLISDTKIILFVFNLENENSLGFLQDGWGPIIERVGENKSKNQERFLIGIRSSSNNNQSRDETQILNVMKKFGCEKYFEDRTVVNTEENQKIGDFPILNIQDLIDHIKGELQKIEKDKDISKTNQKIKNNEETSKKYDKNEFDDNDEYKKNSKENDENSFKKEDEINEGDNDDDIDVGLPNEDDDTFTDDFSVVYKISTKNNSAEIIKSPKAAEKITIPTTIKFRGRDFIVKGICDEAFSDTNIKILNFPVDSQVEKIGNFAFNNSQLEQLFIPKSLTNLSENWRGGTENLSIVNVDPNNPRYFNFDGIICSNIQLRNKDIQLTTFEIHFVQRGFINNFNVNQNFTRIVNYAFCKCQNLKSFTFQNPISKIIDIGDYCFSESKNLSSVTLSSDELSIGHKCFKNCTSLQKFNLLNVKEAQFFTNAFTGCSKITQIDISSSNSLIIANNCFCGVENLKFISLTTEELTIGDFCFKNCKSLTSIYFYNIKNATLGCNVFEGCESLKKFNLIAASNINIGSYCFNELTKLESANFHCEKKLIIGNFCFNKCTLLKSISFQKQTDNRNYRFHSGINMNHIPKSEEIPINEVIFGDNCFEECSSIPSFTFTNIQKIKIGKRSFKGCNKIEKFSLSKGKIIEMDNECFNDMNLFDNLILQSKELHMNDIILNKCNSLTNIQIFTNHSLAISANTFKECNKLMNITLSSKNTLTISEGSFLDLGLLESILLRGNIINIENNCFNKCMNIQAQYSNHEKYLILESQFSIEIENICFNDLYYLKSININCKQLITKEKCFNNCYSLSSLDISNSSETIIGKSNFNTLQNLYSISFNNSNYIEINSDSFKECKNLTEFHIKPNLLPNDFLEFVSEIGRNELCQTYIVNKKENEENFILKLLIKSNQTEPFQKSFFERMIQITRVNNFIIYPYTGFGFITYQSKFYPVIFIDIAPYDPLSEIIKKQIQLSPTNRYIILLGITFGMKYLHSMKINHSHLTINNILIGEQYYPIISDFGLAGLNNAFSYQNDVYSYSIIAYFLITERFPLKNDSLENISSNLKFIKDPKIKELFRRIWLFDLSFVPPFDDILDEIKSERYEKLFKPNKEELSKYLNLIEQTKSNENKSKDYQYDEFEKSNKIIIESDDKVIYKLNKSNYTAEIIKSPKVNGNLFIPKYFEFKLEKYKILRISKEAFSKSSIESLSFSLNSFVESIDEYAFNESKLQKLLIPNSLKKVHDYWIWGAINLSQIEIDPENKNFYSKNGVIYYSDKDLKLPKKEIIFITPNYKGKFTIHPKITHIGCFSIHNCENITSIESHSQSLQISPYSFCFNANIRIISLVQTSFLSIEEKSFYGLDKLKAIEIKSPTLVLKENFIKKCPSLEVIIIEKNDNLELSPNTFNECISITKIRLISHSSIKLENGKFNLPNLVKIEMFCNNQLIIGDDCFASCNYLRSITISSPTISIGKRSFSNCSILAKISFENNQYIIIDSNAFEKCVYLKNILISSSHKIEIRDDCFNNSTNLESINFKSEDINLGYHCLSNCVNLKHILFENVKNATIGPCVFDKCSSLKIFSINVTSNLTISDFCFQGASFLNEVKLICYDLYLGKYIFDGSFYIQTINIQFSGDNYCYYDNTFSNINSKYKINYKHLLNK